MIFAISAILVNSEPFYPHFLNSIININTNILQHDPDGEYTWIQQLKFHFSKFVWIRGLKAKTIDEAADELIK